MPPDHRKTHECRYCHRTFSSYSSVSRHVRFNCKMANSEEGMETLTNRILQKQNETLQAEVGAVRVQLDHLTALFAQMVGENKLTPPQEQKAAAMHTYNNNGPVDARHIHVEVHNTFQLVHFDKDDRIHVPLELVRDAFAENPCLREFCETGDDIRIDAERAAPFILEALIDLVRRAHQDPGQRNIYLNPKRTDQVMVFASTGKWEILTLTEAIRRIFDSVSGQLHRLVLTDAELAKLPRGVQGAVGWVPLHYNERPSRYVDGAKKPLSAHLENNRPTQSSLSPPALTAPDPTRSVRAACARSSGARVGAGTSG